MTETNGSARPDGREPQPCPRCGVVCHFDGWDHVHKSGLGIGSCRPTTTAAHLDTCEHKQCIPFDRCLYGDNAGPTQPLDTAADQPTPAAAIPYEGTERDIERVQA